MGHAGAIISGGKVKLQKPFTQGKKDKDIEYNLFQGTAGTKIEALEKANVIVSKSPAQMGTLLVGAMKGAGLA